MRSTPLGISAGHFTSFRVVSRSQVQCFRRSNRFRCLVRFPAAPLRNSWSERQALARNHLLSFGPEPTHDNGVYDADLAHARARDNARRQRAGTLVIDRELRDVVKAKLEDTWSPQQVSAWLRTEYPDRPAWHICHETIYQALYLGRKGGLSRVLTAKLRTGRPLRKRRRRSSERTPRYVVPAVLIHHRPLIVEARTRIGDWEGDLIVGKHSRSAIGTLVDRTSRAVRLIHLPHGHNAEAFVDAFGHVLARLPNLARRTLTWDQGSEMARHDVLAEHFDEGVYFADPGSPWQRGTNENTGFLRQFFPKGKDLSIYTPDDLARAENLLNSRPRKILNWSTPELIFATGLT
jgi:IS30 family transposase